MVFWQASKQVTGLLRQDSGFWVFGKESTPGKSLKKNGREFSRITAVGRLPLAPGAVRATAKQVICLLEESAREARKRRKEQAGEEQAATRKRDLNQFLWDAEKISLVDLSLERLSS